MTSVAIAETNEDVKKLEERKQLIDAQKNYIDAQKNYIDAQKNLLESQLPKLPDNTGVTGSITFTDINIEKQISVYRAIDRIADRVKKEIIDNVGSNTSLIFIDSGYISSLLDDYINYKNYKNAIEKLKSDYEKIKLISRRKPSRPKIRQIVINPPLTYSRGLPPGNLPSGNLPPGNFQSVNPPANYIGWNSVPVLSDFIFNSLKLFRTDKNFQGSATSKVDRAFKTKLSNKIRLNNQSISIYNPSEYPLVMHEAAKEIIDELNQLNKYLEKTKEIPSDNIIISNFDRDIKDVFQKFSNNQNILKSIIKYASLEKIKSNDNGKKIYFLSIETNAGGTTRSTKNMFTNRLRHSGGVIVNYTIYDDAKVVFSNIHSEYTGFKKIRSTK
ncbi:MAG: hypothetical protein AAGG00_13675 [Cyanobacteria bacterium P01_H01_bin.150]